MNLVFSAGEASGDQYAAALVRALPGRPMYIGGIGGRRFAEAGGDLWADSSAWAAVGILESLKVVPKILPARSKFLKRLESMRPGVFIPIDFGYLNISLARRARELGWKVVYFAPPGSWRRDKQGPDLPAVTDAIVTQFSWSKELLWTAGANAYWFGHPLVEMMANKPFVDPNERVNIGVLPGSRAHEIEHNLAVIVPAVAQLGRTIEIAVASSTTSDVVQGIWNRHGGGEAIFTENDTPGVLGRARAAVVCSGTATLEAAIQGAPQVVVYRGSKWMEFEYKLRKPKFDYISLPNILLDRAVLPELIQHDATVDRVQYMVNDLLDDGPGRTAQLNAYAELASILGPARGISGAAEVIMEAANATRRS
jgi:lipid-A-disaccharide synthase